MYVLGLEGYCETVFLFTDAAHGNCKDTIAMLIIGKKGYAWDNIVRLA